MPSRGLCRTAFRREPLAVDGVLAESAPAPGEEGVRYRAFALPAGAFDRLADLGGISAGRRPGAEIAVWAAVHGLAVLLIEEPPALLADDEKEAVVDRTLAVMLTGFTAA